MFFNLKKHEFISTNVYKENIYLESESVPAPAPTFKFMFHISVNVHICDKHKYTKSIYTYTYVIYGTFQVPINVLIILHFQNKVNRNDEDMTTRGPRRPILCWSSGPIPGLQRSSDCDFEGLDRIEEGVLLARTDPLLVLRSYSGPPAVLLIVDLIFWG